MCGPSTSSTDASTCRTAAAAARWRSSSTSCSCARSTTSGCAQGNDGARFAVPPGRMVIATDSHVVSPLFFPGGDIGCLSVHGTINDVAMAGATPLYLAAGFILEEGFPLADLKRIVESMAAAAREAGVPIVTGDTKVVEQGKGDGVFITTTGVGVVPDGVDICRRSRASRATRCSSAARSATTAWRSCRCARTSRSRRPSRPTPPRCTGSSRRWSPPCPGIHCLRDPDARRARDDAERDRAPVGLRHRDRRERAFRSQPQVSGGLRVPRPRPALRRQRRQAGRDLRGARTPTRCSRRCARIRWAATRRSSARSIADPHHFVQMDTRFGGRRIVDWLTGEQLPRIC